jgi:Cu-Zn family superoxide dismutase
MFPPIELEYLHAKGADSISAKEHYYRRMTNRLRILVCASVFTSVTFAANRARVEFKNAEGQDVGSATLTPENAEDTGGVRVTLDLHGLPAGEHAIHFHQNAKCDPPGFTSAGPHFNPENKKHGLHNPAGPHAGDMENFVVGANGTAQVEVVAPGVTLNHGDTALLSNGGRSLVIHAHGDDMVTDPAGNSGARIACGVVAAE